MKLHETPKGFTQSSSLLGDALDPRSEHGRSCFASSLCKLEDGFLRKPCSFYDQTVLAARDIRRVGVENGGLCWVEHGCLVHKQYWCNMQSECTLLGVWACLNFAKYSLCDTRTAVEGHLQSYGLSQQIVSALLPKVWKTDEPPAVLCWNPRQTSLSSFPANDYTPSSVTWAGGRLPHPAEIGARVPQVNPYGVFARCNNRYRDFGTHKLQQMPSRTNSKGQHESKWLLCCPFRTDFPGRLIVPAYAESGVASPSSPKHYRMNRMEMRSLRIRFFTL